MKFNGPYQHFDSKQEKEYLRRLRSYSTALHDGGNLLFKYRGKNPPSYLPVFENNKWKSKPLYWGDVNYRGFVPIPPPRYQNDKKFKKYKRIYMGTLRTTLRTRLAKYYKLPSEDFQDVDGRVIGIDEIFTSMFKNDGIISKVIEDLNIKSYLEFSLWFHINMPSKDIQEFFIRRTTDCAAELIMEEVKRGNLHAAEVAIKYLGRNRLYESNNNTNIQINNLNENNTPETQAKRVQDLFGIVQKAPYQQDQIQTQTIENVELKPFDSSDNVKVPQNIQDDYVKEDAPNPDTFVQSVEAVDFSIDDLKKPMSPIDRSMEVIDV